MSARIDGAFYDPALDGARLTTQLERVRAIMSDGRWHTVAYVASIIHAPEASVSAQIRNLRKPENGGHTIETRRADDGLFIYRLQDGERL